ncbi:hypothetical protein [Gordonia polyisoprenivorans]|uniref:hypothetical protein n=1 Tax=Gordonia polyisoprenivorans TaxID=84595 RepID=UPI001FF76393|nr:hypothetical protein [Gordonia polyisoprenivorans]
MRERRAARICAADLVPDGRPDDDAAEELEPGIREIAMMVGNDAAVPERAERLRSA